MRSLVTRFLAPLLVVLVALTLVAAWLVDSTSRRWSDRDVLLRTQLAMRGAELTLRNVLVAHDGPRARQLLEALTRDERLLAAAICDSTGAELARTDLLDPRHGCAAVAAWAPVAADAAQTSRDDRLGELAVKVAVVPILAGEAGAPPLGHVIVVHDMSFAARRAATTQGFVVAALGLLAILASAATLLIVRVSFRHFTDEARRVLHGERPPDQTYRPLLHDVRELAARLAEERLEHEGARWSPERLRHTLRHHLDGERVIIMANREPYIHEKVPGGGARVLHPASGLVTALEPVMRACSGVWVAHGSGSADRENADAAGRLRVPPTDPAYTLRRVWLTPEEEHGYYYGFANEGLWPLCHVAHTRPQFRADDFAAYDKVNRRFAEAAAEEAGAPDPVVLVQDYHFALAPAALRKRLPRATIINFWHVPWPSAERFGICPWRSQLLEGLLGASILGFHTQGHVNNFLESVDRYLEARIDREIQGVIHQGHTTLVRAYPISVEWPNRWAMAAPPVDECRAGVRAELGLAPGTLLGVGVDRLDYTKGIEERFQAVERLLERAPHLVGKFVFVQLAAPSRTEIERYKSLAGDVEAVVARINQRFGKGNYQPIMLLREHHEPPRVFRYYRAADVVYVSSLHDGMNLVAKEFVAARDDERGVLVLSSFAGAAKELTEALVVNPYDLEQASQALLRAVTMAPAEQALRMRAMRQLVSELNVFRWAGRMLVDAARLRRKDRLSSEVEAA